MSPLLTVSPATLHFVLLPGAGSLRVHPVHKVIELDPLDCAIDEMTRKVETIRLTTTAAEPDMIFLQMQLQGTLSLQVNAGPLEYAKTFCAPNAGYEATKVKVRSGMQEDIWLVM